MPKLAFTNISPDGLPQSAVRTPIVIAFAEPRAPAPRLRPLTAISLIACGVVVMLVAVLAVYALFMPMQPELKKAISIPVTPSLAAAEAELQEQLKAEEAARKAAPSPLPEKTIATLPEPAALPSFVPLASNPALLLPMLEKLPVGNINPPEPTPASFSISVSNSGDRSTLDLAERMATEGRTEQAIRLYKKADAAAPGNAVTRHNLVALLLDRAALLDNVGETEKAISAYNEALRYGPEDADIAQAIRARVAYLQQKL